MKNIKVLFAILAFSLSFVASGASAEDCSWGASQLNSSNGSWTIKFLCRSGSSTVATKTTVIPIKGQPTCSMSLASGYNNTGSCISPNIVKGQPCQVINIGMSCRGENWCAEAFGRACYSAGGKTVFENGNMVCKSKSCK